MTENIILLTELITRTFSKTFKRTCRFRTFCHITIVPEQPAASSVETPGHPVAIWISVLVCINVMYVSGHPQADALCCLIYLFAPDLQKL